MKIKNICCLPAACFPLKRRRSPRRAGASSEWDLCCACFPPTAFEGRGMDRAFGKHDSSGQDVNGDREISNL